MKLSLIFVIFLFLIGNSLAISLEQGGIEQYHGREIKVVSIKENQVIVSVDDEKKIFENGQEKEINGVKIKVEEIFYANELSSVELNLNLSYDCGDEVCDEWENSAICCKDCGCEENKKCISNECVISECLVNNDCNDNNELTEDKCSEYKCDFKQIKCKKDSDCDDSNQDTDDTCVNGKCKNILNYICKENIDCDDQNECTEDLCINKDCQYKVKDNCEYKGLEEGEKIVVEKEGFFSRLINWFKGIF